MIYASGWGVTARAASLARMIPAFHWGGDLVARVFYLLHATV
jgi:hypothetical protein